MNDHLNILEQSILQQDAAQVTQQNLSLGERHPVLYLGFMLLFSAMAYAWILLFPLALLVLVVSIPYDLYQASSYLDYSIVSCKPLQRVWQDG